MSRKWPMWFEASWDSMPSVLRVYGTAMMPALLMIMSSDRVAAETWATALRTKELSSRLIGMKVVCMFGSIALMSSMTGWILLALRPRRSMWAGWAWARVLAVSAPRPPTLAPVIRTGGRQSWKENADVEAGKCRTHLLFL